MHWLLLTLPCMQSLIVHDPSNAEFYFSCSNLGKHRQFKWILYWDTEALFKVVRAYTRRHSCCLDRFGIQRKTDLQSSWIWPFFSSKVASSTFIPDLTRYIIDQATFECFTEDDSFHEPVALQWQEWLLADLTDVDVTVIAEFTQTPLHTLPQLKVAFPVT